MTKLTVDEAVKLLQQNTASQPKKLSVNDAVKLLQAQQDNKPTKDLGTLPPMKFEAEIGKPSATKSFILGAVNNVGGGINQLFSGAKDFGSSAINKLLGTDLKTDRYKEVTQETKAVDDAYEKSRAKAGQTGSDGWRTVGSFAGSIPFGFGGIGKNLATTAAKSGGLGASIGGVQFAENSDERLKNAGAGAVGGAVGGVAGRELGKMATNASKKLSEKATQKALDAPKNTLTKQARDAGYIVPPSYSNPNVFNKSLSKIAGEADLGKIASSKNQDVTNRLAKKAVGLPDNQPLTPEALGVVRQEASKAYDVVNSLGRVKIDQRYHDDYNKIIEPYLKMAADFNLEVSDDVIRMMQQANPKNGSFEASSAIHAIRALRAHASKAYKAGDTELGKAARSLSEAFERQLERALVKNTKIPREAIHNYANARKVIAKTHSIEDALNEVGDVSATKLASILGKGAPLDGELKQVAQFGATYPQLNNVGRHGGAGVTFADTLMGAGGAMVDPTGFGLIVARPALRHSLATESAGKLTGTPSYNSKLLRSLEKAGILSPHGAAAGSNINIDRERKSK